MTPLEHEEIGDRIRQRRKELGLTLKDVAHQVGITHPALINWEKGSVESYKEPHFSKLAEVLQTTTDWLLNGDNLSSPPTGLGGRIAERMKELEISQAQVARDLGITRSAVSQWFTGKTRPSSYTIIQLAQLLKTNEKWLIYGYGPKESSDTIDVHALLSNQATIAELYTALKQKLSLLPEGSRAAMLELIYQGLSREDDAEQMKLMMLLQQDANSNEEME